MTYVVGEPCIDVNDRSCIEQCPVDCIYQGDRMVYINPDECIECGACEHVCPVNAIQNEYDLAGAAQEFVAVNAEFVELFHATGGATGFEAGGDHPRVAAAPRSE